MQSSIPIKEVKFAQKPNLNNQSKGNQHVNLISNYLKISLNPQKNLIWQYSLKFFPEIDPNNILLRTSIFKHIHRELRQNLHFFIVSGDSIFSTRKVEEKIEIKFTRIIENSKENYIILIEPTQNSISLSDIKKIDNFSQKVKSFMEIVFKNIIKQNDGIVRFNSRNIFDFKASSQISDTSKN